MLRPVRRLSLFLLFASLSLLLALGCSDDDTDVDAGVDAMVPDTGTVTADLGPDQALPDLGPDGPVSGCNAATVGKACTSGGSECGKDHTCLVLGSGKGFCTCTCTEDNLDSALSDEDTCPTPLRCAQYAPSGGTKKGYCFKSLGGARKVTSSWYTAEDTTKASTLAAKVAPASYPFTAVAVAYTLTKLGKYCDLGLAHKAELVVSSAADPPASPTATATFTEAAATVSGNHRRLMHPLSAPKELKSGESAFLLLQLSVDSANNTAVCLMSATAANGTKALYLAEETTAPYTWQSSNADKAELSVLGF